MGALTTKLKTYTRTRPNRSKALFAALLIAVIVLVSTIVTLLILTVRETPTTSPPQTTQATAEVSITKDGFVPAALSVKKGTKIIWTNSDGATHQLQANPHPTGKSLPGLKSEILNNKQTYSYTANKAGSFGYHDHLSPTMNGSLDVKE